MYLIYPLIYLNYKSLYDGIILTAGKKHPKHNKSRKETCFGHSLANNMDPNPLKFGAGRVV